MGQNFLYIWWHCQKITVMRTFIIKKTSGWAELKFSDCGIHRELRPSEKKHYQGWNKTATLSSKFTHALCISISHGSRWRFITCGSVLTLSTTGACSQCIRHRTRWWVTSNHITSLPETRSRTFLLWEKRIVNMSAKSYQYSGQGHGCRFQLTNYTIDIAVKRE